MGGYMAAAHSQQEEIETLRDEVNNMREAQRDANAKESASAVANSGQGAGGLFGSMDVILIVSLTVVLIPVLVIGICIGQKTQQKAIYIDGIDKNDEEL